MKIQDSSGDGGPPYEADINPHDRCQWMPSGNIYIADVPAIVFVKCGHLLPSAASMAAGDISFAEENGFGHIMSSSGFHKKTIDLEYGNCFA